MRYADIAGKLLRVADKNGQPCVGIAWMVVERQFLPRPGDYTVHLKSLHECGGTDDWVHKDTLLGMLRRGRMIITS